MFLDANEKKLKILFLDSVTHVLFFI